MTEPAKMPSYWIREGVRRAKAHVISGFVNIECEVYDADSQFLGLRQIPIDQLRTTKHAIEVNNPKRLDRFESIVRAVSEGRNVPPIVVEEPGRGWPLDEVPLDYEGVS